MKFISKNSNLRLVLKPGVSANQLAGVAGKNGVYVKFQDGILETDDEKLIEKMVAHPGFKIDFIMVGDDGEDPYAHRREEVEPVHIMQEMKYGQVEKVSSSPNRRAKIDPKIKKLVDEMAFEQAKKLLPAMVEETVKKIMEISDKKKEAELKAAESSTGQKTRSGEKDGEKPKK